MQSKKIVIISPAHPLRGGIAASSERLAVELQQMGHEVVIFSFYMQYPSFLFPGKTQLSDSPANPALKIRSTISSIQPFSWLHTAYLIGKVKPDVIITRYWMPFMGPCLGTILLLAKAFGAVKAKRVALVDNLIPHEKRFGDKLLSRYFTWANDAFVAMSESVRTDIRTMEPKKLVAVSPHPIYDNYGEPLERDAALQQLNLDPNHHWVMFFGLSAPTKALICYSKQWPTQEYVQHKSDC